MILSMIILILSTMAYHYARQREEDLFTYVYRENTRVSIRSILESKKNEYLKTTFDYATWDEMVYFTRTGDRDWIDKNLATVVETLDLSFFYVFNKDLKPLYQSYDSSKFTEKFILPDSLIRYAFTKRSSCHFFNITNQGILEISGYTIVHTPDVKHLSSPHGYVLLGRAWDPAYVKTIERSSNSDIEIVPLGKASESAYTNDPKEKDNIIVHEFLSDFASRNIVRLDFIPKSQLFLNQKLFYYSTIIPIVLSVLFAVLFYVVFRAWITIPLHLVFRSLSKEDPGLLQKIPASNREFSALARMIESFFESKKNLELEMESRKTAETKLNEYARKMKESNISKDKFFSILAHDLKSPFHSMLGYLEILANDYENLQDAERRKFIGIIRKSAKNVFELLENLLQWSRIQSGKLENSPTVFDLSQEIKFIVDIFQATALRKSIDFSTNISANTYVKADINMIRSVLQNLISNALKFTGLNGKVQISSAKHADYLEVIVSDNGIGMTPREQSMLFRIDETFTRKGTDHELGTGLGLIITKELLEKSNGRIWFESEPDKGSAFHFTVPAS